MCRREDRTTPCRVRAPARSSSISRAIGVGIGLVGLTPRVGSHAVCWRLASCSPNASMAVGRIWNFCILPVAVIGDSLVTVR